MHTPIQMPQMCKICRGVSPIRTFAQEHLYECQSFGCCVGKPECVVGVTCSEQQHMLWGYVLTVIS
jgi:hypothetical protein